MVEPESHSGRALVTGATGCLGRAVVRTLLDQGYEVNALVRDRQKVKSALGRYFNHGRLRVIAGDLLDLESLRNAVAGVDTIFHAAAAVHLNPKQATEEDFYRVNVAGTKKLLQAAKKNASRRFVLFSTVAVYGNQQLGVLTENTPVRPDSAYARSKYEAEAVLASELSSGLRFVILRLPLVYGPGDRGNLLRMVKAIDHHRFLLIDGGRARKSVIFSADAAGAAVRAAFLESANGKILLVADPEPYEIGIIARTISSELGKRIFPISVPSNVAKGALNVAAKGLKIFGIAPEYDSSVLTTLTSDRICDVSKMKSLLGYVPEVNLQAGIKQTIQWYKESKDPHPGGSRSGRDISRSRVPH